MRAAATRPRTWDLLAVALNLLVIGFLTLRPSSGNATWWDATCVLCGQRGSADLLLNVLLFAPLGAALGRLGMRPVLIAGIGLALAFGIEVAQTTIPGRAPTWRDVITNSVGAGLGAVTVQWMVPLVRSAWARTLAWVAGGLVVAAIALTGWLLRAEVKPSSWFGQVVPRLWYLFPWRGEIESVSVGAIPVRHGRMPDAAAVQSAVSARAPIVMHGRAAPPPAGVAALFAITDEEFEEMLLIGQVGVDLVVRERRRASTFRLFEPEHRFPDLFAGLSPGTAFTLEVRPAPTSVCATLNERVACADRFAASSAWTFLIWRRWYGSALQRTFGAFTMAVLFLPVGLFGAALPPRTRGILFVVVAAGVLGAAYAGALAPPSSLEIVAACLAILAGHLAGARFRRPASSQGPGAATHI